MSENKKWCISIIHLASPENKEKSVLIRVAKESEDGCKFLNEVEKLTEKAKRGFIELPKDGFVDTIDGRIDYAIHVFENAGFLVTWEFPFEIEV